jgi:hypothetical protein
MVGTGRALLDHRGERLHQRPGVSLAEIGLAHHGLVNLARTRRLDLLVLGQLDHDPTFYVSAPPWRAKTANRRRASGSAAASWARDTGVLLKITVLQPEWMHAGARVNFRVTYRPPATRAVN